MIEVISMIQAHSALIVIMSIAIVLDMITGVIKAILEHDLKSKEFRSGLLKKCLDYVLVVIGFCLEYVLQADYISNGVLYCLMAMEFYSVLENIRGYVPIPSVLQKALEQMQASQDTADTEQGDAVNEEVEEECQHLD